MLVGERKGADRTNVGPPETLERLLDVHLL